MRLDNSSGRLRQVFATPVDTLDLTVVRLPSLDDVHTRLVRRLGEPIDLNSNGPSFAELVELAVDDHVLILILHHAVTDTHADDMFIRELLLAYASYSQNAEPSLPPPMKFSDYVWSEVKAGRKLGERQLAQWRDVLRGSVPAIPGVRATMAPPSATRGRVLFSSMDAAETQRLEAFAAGARMGLASLMYAIALLAVWEEFGQKDVRLVVTYSGRHANALDTLGAATSRRFPLRICLDAAMTVGDLAKKVQGAYMRGAIGSRPPFTYMRAVAQLVAESAMAGTAETTESNEPRVDLMVTDALIVQAAVPCPGSDLRVSRVMSGPLLSEHFEMVDAENVTEVMPLDVLLRRDLADGPGHPLTFVAVFDTKLVAEETARALLDRMRRVAAMVSTANTQTPLGRLMSEQPRVCNLLETVKA
jgi:hypothetical protein